jgi:hypothetical protein
MSSALRCRSEPSPELGRASRRSPGILRRVELETGLGLPLRTPMAHAAVEFVISH